MDDHQLDQLKHLVARTTAKLEHWVHPVHGTAFMITKTHALTCAHCLQPKGSNEWARKVTLYFSRWGNTGELWDADVIGEPDWERDIAVLRLVKEITLEVSPFPLALNAARHTRWETFAHPSPGADAGLTLDGTIQDPWAYLPHRQSQLRVIQLTCHQAQDSIKGASGAPVVVDHLIIGMLNNQLVVKREPECYSPGAPPQYKPVYATAYALPFEAIQDLLRAACPGLLVRPPIAGPPRVEPPLTFRSKSLTLRPRESNSGTRLPYAYEAVEFVGRHQEWSELLAFLAPQPQRSVDFAWWLWTAPGGQGKSRLAFRLCMEMRQHGWWCGFLSSAEEFDRWQEWVVDQPTLIVIDHIASRAKKIQQAICALSRHAEHIRAPLRLLLLERRFQPEDGWVEKFVPQAYQEDMADFFAYAYDPTGEHSADALQCYERQLGPLGDDDLWQIVQTVLGKHGIAPPDRHTTLALLKQIDPLARPLFAILAADAMGTEGPDRIRRWNRTDLATFILQREVSLWKERLQLTGPGVAAERRRNFEEHLNLIIFATITGQDTTYACERLRRHAVPVPDRILPDWLREMTGYAWDDAQATVPSFTPDILGELFILERLLGNFGVDTNTQVPREQTQRVLDVALAWATGQTVAFIRRCVEDFPEHPALERFTAMQIPEGPAANDGLYQDYSVAMQQVADILQAAGREALVEQVWTQLIEVGQSLRESRPRLLDRYRRLAIFFYNRAVSRRRQNNSNGAEQDCDEAIARIARLFQEREPSGIEDYRLVQVRASALRLRAILRGERHDVSRAFADLECILADRQVAASERAEALLCRAELHHDQEDDRAALRDYEEILGMSEARLDEQRRLAIEEVIPLLWREAHRASRSGDYHAALQRFEQLLTLAPDRADLQAMVHVNRSEMHWQHGALEAAIADCDAVLHAPDAPRDQQLKALVHRSQLYLRLQQFGPAAEDVEQLLGSADVDVRGRSIALLTRAQIRFAEGDTANALEELLTITRQHDLDPDIRRAAEHLLTQWGSRER